MRRTVLNIIIFLAFLALPPRDSVAQATGERGSSSADSTLYQWKAGNLKFREVEGKRVVFLSDSVRIDHQAATITSLTGMHYLDEKKFILEDEVHAVDGTMEIFGEIGKYFGLENILTIEKNVRCLDRGMEVTCERGRYNRVSTTVFLTGNVVLTDSTRELYADTVIYNRNTGIANAYGSVVIINPAQDYSISGPHARYDREKSEAYMDGYPVLIFDRSQQEPGRIKSAEMLFNMELDRGTAVGDVRIIKGETSAECDSAIIFNDQGYVELLGDPRSRSGLSEMRGKRTGIYFSEREVNTIILPEFGRISEKPPRGSRWWKDSWIEGDSIVIHLSDEDVDSVRVFGSARAMYYPSESEKGKVSNNFSSGDTMFFRFRRKNLIYVNVTGNTEGIYKYMHLEDNETIDSLAAETDTALTYRDFNSESEKIKYSGNNIEYFADTEDISIDRSASIDYQNKTLEADHIDFNSKLNILKAEGSPVLKEHNQEMYGYEMGYDMDRNGGLVTSGSTQYDNGYYRGGHIFKDGKDILKVYDSIYTTCDLKSPHYSFRSHRMKVYMDDKVVSGPITLYLGEMPIFYLPFMANSIRRDRHSGILRPNFDIGINSRDGRFIRGLGYYWATNDYTDFTLTGDFNEYQNIRFHLENRYKVRYLLNGNADFNFVRNFRDKTSEWTVNASHNQTFSKTSSFRSNLKFVSSDQAQRALNNVDDVDRVVDRRIYSTASYNKSWGGTRLGLSANRDQKLNVDSPTDTRISSTLPRFSLNFPRISLWFGGKRKGSERSIWERALRSITFSPNLRGERRERISEAEETTELSASSGLGLSQQHKILFLNFSPSMSLNWNYSNILSDRVDTTYIKRDSREGEVENEYSMRFGAGIGTTLYGIFYPRLGPVSGIRHTFNPSFNYSYTPRLREGQVMNRSLSYSVRNIIDLKVRQGDEVVKKNNVLTWNISGNYDPDREKGQRFSNIRSGLRTSLGGKLSLSLNQTYDPREKEIISTSFNADLALSGSFSYPATWSVKQQERVAAAASGAGNGGGGETGPGERNWSLAVGYSFSERGSGTFSSVTSKVDLRGNISLTRNWRISYSGYYDLDADQFTSQQYTLERDLHCWKASFIHRRFGNEWSYYFQISVKELPDIMYERGKRGIRSSVPYM
ncbi:MAG: putative LPS assembly protein LptD [Candidatus Krumholzibacteriales bacterium]